MRYKACYGANFEDLKNLYFVVSKKIHKKFGAEKRKIMPSAKNRFGNFLNSFDIFKHSSEWKIPLKGNEERFLTRLKKYEKALYLGVCIGHLSCSI